MNWRSLLPAALAISIGFFGARPASAQNGSSVIDQLMDNAAWWMEQGREDKAAEVWQKILRSDPSHAEALVRVALYEARRGRGDVARTYLDRLRAQRPNDSQIQAIQKAIEIGPAFRPRVDKARALAREGHRREAVKMYQQAFGGGTPPLDAALEYYQTLGGVSGGWREARVGLESMVRRSPRSVRYQLALAQHLTYQGETRNEGIRRLQSLAKVESVSKDAIASWKTALLWLPAARGTAGMLRTYLDQVGADAQIQARLQQLQASKVDENYLEDAFKALDKEEVDRAESLFQRQSAQGGRNADVLVGLAMVAMQKEEFDRAKEILLEVKQLVPDRPEMWERSLRSAEFWSLMAAGKKEESPEAAREKFMEALAQVDGTERFHAHLEIANTYMAENNDVMAELSIRKALAIDQTNPSALRMLVDVLLRTNRGDAALETNRELAQVSVDEAYQEHEIAAEILRNKANLSREAGHLEDARTLLRRAHEQDPESTLALLDLAYVELELGNTVAARKAAEDLLALDPLSLDARVASARIFEREKRQTAALAALDGISDAEMSEDVLALKHRLQTQREVTEAVRHFHAHKPMEARHRLTQIQRQVENNVDLLAIVALGWSDIGSHDRALALLGDALLRSPDNDPSIRLQLASVQMKAGKEAEFLATVRELREEPALSYWERRGLAEIRIAHGVTRTDELREAGNNKQAFSFLSPLMQEYPEEPKLLAALGRIFYSAQQYKAALAAFERVLAKDPDNLEGIEGYVLAAIPLRKEREARAILEAALERSPRNPRLHLIAGRFRSMVGERRKAMDSLMTAEALVGRITDDEQAEEDELLSGAMEIFGAESAVTGMSPRHSLHSEIEEELAKLRSTDRVKIQTRPLYRRRDGRNGLDALNAVEIPTQILIPSSIGRLEFSVTPVTLNPGRLEGTKDVIAFASYALQAGVAPVQPPDMSAQGVAMHAHYRLGGFSAGVGTTPLGFHQETIVGDARFEHAVGGFGVAAEGFRRPVRDSLLSYAGLQDPLTGITWGAVIEQGGRIDLGFEDRAFTYYLFGGYRILTGVGIPDNTATEGGLGARWTLYDQGNAFLQAGLNVSGKSFDKNLRHFTTGHGGYFSPQLHLHVGVPFHLAGEADKLSWQAQVEPGTNWFNEDPAPYYPGHPDLQAAVEQQQGVPTWYDGTHTTGFALDGAVNVAYEIRDGVHLGARAELHSAADYRELVGQAFIEFDFLRNVKKRPSSLVVKPNAPKTP